MMEKSPHEMLIRISTSNLLNAAYQGKLETVKESALELSSILAKDVHNVLELSMDEEGRRAIHVAAAGGSLDVLKYLAEEIRLDVNVLDDSGTTPLCLAALEGHTRTVLYLIKMDADPDLANKKMMYPIHYAAMKGHNDVIIVLQSFSKLKNIDVKNDFGTPLQFACANGQYTTVQMLLTKYKSDHNLVFNRVSTPLIASIHSRSVQCVRHLLESGANPNGGPDEVKALSVAADVGVVEIIRLLVENRADPNVTNMGIKPIEVAARHGNRQAVELLFPLTSPIPSYVNWSIDGIMQSEMFGMKMILKEQEIFRKAKSKGKRAFRRKEYWLAAYWYTEALGVCPSSADVLSQRCLCYIHLKNGEYALEDAERCLQAKPDWEEALVRKAEALKLVKLQMPAGPETDQEVLKARLDLLRYCHLE